MGIIGEAACEDRSAVVELRLLFVGRDVIKSDRLQVVVNDMTKARVRIGRTKDGRQGQSYTVVAQPRERRM